MCCISRNRSASTPEKPKSNKPHTTYTLPDVSLTTGCGHRKWKETKQQLSMLPGPAMPGCWLISFRFMLTMLWPHTSYVTDHQPPHVATLCFCPILGPITSFTLLKRSADIVCTGWMAHRKWKEIEQQPSMLPGLAVPGCCLVSFYILWAILRPHTV